MTLHDLLFLAATIVTSAILSWLATGWVRRFALARNVMDIPNERSSHTVATPRGGGVAIVATFLLAISALWLVGSAPSPLAAALLGGGVLVAFVGFADDRWGVAAKWRFTAHVTAAIWVLGSLWPVAAIAGWGLQVDSEWILVPAFVVLITWSINLFNFMDGIDGIASIEAIAIMLGGALLAWVTPVPMGAAPPLALAASTAGFLVWNWPPARIFMGDAGSGFLGLVVSTLALWHASQAPQLFWSWLILMGCFMVDATTTLLRRVWRGERFHVAHRSHAYQYASRRLGSHLPVSLAFGAITLFWLLPWAAAVALQRIDGAWALLLAYAPVIATVYAYRAGDSANQAS